MLVHTLIRDIGPSPKHLRWAFDTHREEHVKGYIARPNHRNFSGKSDVTDCQQNRQDCVCVSVYARLLSAALQLQLI